MAAPVIQKAYIQDINRPIEVRHGGGLMFTGDAKADRISVSLYDCQTPFSLSGSVTATCIRNDGATVVLTGGITGGNTAYAVLEQSCFVVPGPLAVTIRVSAGGVSTTVLKAVYTIDQTTTEEIVDPGHVVPDISDIVAEYERMQAASDAAEAAAENANEAAQFATDDEWTNGDTLQTGRVYQTLHMANFEEETAGQYLRVISGNVAQAERVNQSGWSVYRYDLPHRMLIRLEAIDKNTPTVQGVLPMAAVLTSGNTETLYSLDSDRTGTYILADALLVNYSTTLNASAIKSVSITAVANRQFEDVIVCLDHAADFDKIVVFGDSIFANYISSSTVGNGVMAQFAALMGLPVENNAVGGATLSTIQTSPKNVVQQVQDYIASATPGGTPLYMIDGGTNDQYNNGAGLNNLGQYTDGVNGITNTIYGATYRIINDLLGFGAQPWQIVITTPIPKGIRGDAAYVATMDAQLTAIAGAMAEIAMVQQCNVINGYGSPFDNLTTDTAKAVIMPDDTHPSVYGAKLYAERIFRLLGVANQQEVASLKSAIDEVDTAVFGNRQTITYVNDEYVANGGTFTAYATWSRTDYLDCTGLTRIEYKNTGIATAYNAFYDANEDYISMFKIEISQDGRFVTVPPNAKYFVISQKTSDIASIVWTNIPSEGGLISEIDRLDDDIAAVDGKVDVIDDKIITSPNILDLNSGWVNNKYIKSNNGELADYTGWKACETYIPVEAGKTYTVIYFAGTEWSTNTSTFYAFYNASKTYTRGAIMSSGNPAVAQSGDAYIRVSFANAIYDGKPMLGLLADMSAVTGDISAYTEPGNELVNDINSGRIDELSARVDSIVTAPEIVLPAKVYAVVGSQFNIYTENVLLCNNFDDYCYYWTVRPFTMTYDLYSDCLRFTPTSENIGTYTITLNIKRKSDWVTIASQSMVLEVVANTTRSGKSVVFIGDSLTNSGYYPYEIQNVLSGGGVESIGTVTSSPWIGNVQVTITHEGRGGWSIEDYVTLASKGGVENAFWNPQSNKFDFGYWLSHNSFSMPDLVFINLGTNGANDYDTNIDGIDEMIASIRASSATVPILISLITPPATQDGWTYANHGGSADQFKVFELTLNKRYIEEYDGRENEHIYLSPVYFNLDRYHDYNTAQFPVSARNPELVTLQTNNVHPSKYGYYKFADVYWAMAQKLL